MSSTVQAKVAIVDYGMGNLFSVKQACAHAGMDAEITTSKETILNAPAVILPGIGAFRDAMATLRRNDLLSVLRDVAASGKPFMGICLGMQLLMNESHEFGLHRGLEIIEGDVVRLHDLDRNGHELKVPHIGWNRIEQVRPWAGSLMEGLPNGSYMYFVHSYYTRPAAGQLVLSTTRFGDLEFCSSFRRNNVFACQFHPERSGPEGLKLYNRLASLANLVTMRKLH